MKSLIVFISFFISIHLVAQEDVFALSPFVVELDEGYLANNTLAGTRVRTSVYSQEAPVKLRRKADSVTMSISLKNNSRKAIERNDEIMGTVSAIIEKADSIDNIRAHNGSISLSTRNRKVGLFKSTDESSEVTIYILGDLKDGDNVYDMTSKLKKFLEEIQPVGNTTIEEGNIGLSIRNPQSYRNEILGLILNDISNIKEQLGGYVDMNISGLDSSVLVKQANESEVDLYISYSFSLHHTTKGPNED